LKKFHFRLVSHALSVPQKGKGMSYSKLFLMALMEHKPTDLEYVIHGGKSWFFLSYPHDSVWGAPRDDLPVESNTLARPRCT
jgi:hypothetical protein